MRRTWITLLVLGLAAAPGAAQVCELVEATTTPANGSLAQPAILGTNAYVAGGSAGIVRFDLSTRLAAELIGSTPTGGQAMDIAVDYFSSRLVVANGSAGVATVLIDQVGNPVITGSLDLGETIISVVGSAGQFVAGSQEGTIYTLAIGGDTVSLVGSAQVGGPVRGLAVSGSTAFCAAGTAGLVPVDLTNRSEPVPILPLDLGGSVVSVVTEGSLIFCGVDPVGLVSVRQSEGELYTASSLALPGAPTRMVSWGGRLYLVGPELGVAEADASLGTDVLLLSRLDLAGANGVALSADVLYVGRGAQGLAVVDATDCSQHGALPTARFIPAAARATGAADTYWVTDLAIANLTGSVAVCNLAYLAKNQANGNPLNTSLVLAAGEQQLLADVLASLFELESGNGALRITASHPDVKATSRTYNAAGAAGTYGQFIPASSRDQALEPGVVGSLLQLQENADFRSNIGLLNTTELTVQVEVDLYLGSGNLVGVRTETLLPFEMVQVDRIFATVGAGTVDSGFATVKVLTADGKVMAYASVVDNRSGDPIFIPAQTLTAGF